MTDSRVTGTKIHAAVEANGFPVSVVCSPANVHDSVLFADMMKSISSLAGGSMADQIASVYADKGYDSAAIRNRLKGRGIVPCISYRKGTKSSGDSSHKRYGSVQYVAEWLFGWLKSRFHRTIIRYERSCDNYLGFVYLASIVTYLRELG